MAASTLFVNQTGDVVKVKVGSRHASAPIASIAANGGQFRLPVNMNATYREFVVGVDSDDVGKTAIVTSDDCCDYQCITITDVIADGTIDLLRQPRQQQTPCTAGNLDHGITPAAKSKTWFTWKLWL